MTFEVTVKISVDADSADEANKQVVSVLRAADLSVDTNITGWMTWGTRKA